MAGYQVNVKGLDAMRRALRLLDPEFAKALRVANLEVAERIVLPVARQEAPRISGRLAGDLRATATQRVARVSVGRTRVPYAGPIHWGWRRRNIAPNPFIRRAVDRTETQIERAYEGAVSRALDAAGFR